MRIRALLPGPGRDRLLRIEQISRLRLVVPVPETEAGGIVRGGAVMFTVPAYPGQQFRGAISRVAHSIDLKSRTMAVEADVANAGGKLAPGMYAPGELACAAEQARTACSRNRRRDDD